MNNLQSKLIKALADLLMELNSMDDHNPRNHRQVIRRRRVGRYEEITVKIREHQTIRGEADIRRFSYVVGRIDKIRMVIWPNDHGDSHFHAIGHDFDIKIDIESAKLMRIKYGDANSKTIKKVQEWAIENRDLCREAWDSKRVTDFEVGFKHPKGRSGNRRK
jgi:hypothetical protein